MNDATTNRDRAQYIAGPCYYTQTCDDARRSDKAGACPACSRAREITAALNAAEQRGRDEERERADRILTEMVDRRADYLVRTKTREAASVLSSLRLARHVIRDGRTG